MKESVIQHVTEKMRKIKISKLPRDKKYLITQDTRQLIKDNDTEYLGILPIKSTYLPVYNLKKEFFLHQTNIITYLNQMICLPVKNTKKSRLKIVQEFIKEEMEVKVPATKITKILEVENSKIQLYLVNLSDFKFTSGISKKQSPDNLVEQIDKLSLEETICIDKLNSKNYRFQKILDFYNEIKVRESIKDMYQNIGRLKQNKYRLQKCIPLKLPDSNKEIQFKYGFIYSRIK